MDEQNSELISNNENNPQEILVDNGPSPYNNNGLKGGVQQKYSRRRRNILLIVVIIFLFFTWSSNFFRVFDFPGEGKSRSFNEDISDCSEVFLDAKNGSIIVEGYDGKEIKVDVKYRSRTFFGNDDVKLQLKKEEDRIYLDYDDHEIASLSIEAQIPRDLFTTMILDTSNGNIEMQDVKVKVVEVETSNASVTVEQWDGEQLEIDTSNGPAELEDVFGDKVKVKTSNASITADNVEAKNTVLKTSNGEIIFELDELSKYSEYDTEFDTSNGDIELELPQDKQMGYKVDGKTSNGRISYYLDDFQEKENTKNVLKGETRNYDEANIKVDIEMKTSNGSITVE